MQVKAWSFSFETGGLSASAISKGIYSKFEFLDSEEIYTEKELRTRFSALVVGCRTSTPAKDALPVYEQKNSYS